MAIITISHEMGAGGPEIGMTVAQRLGYRYADHELILDTAQRYGLLEEKLSHLDESKPSFFERLDTETHQYITAIQTTLLEFAAQDNVVLMGRSGQRLPRGCWPTAPPSLRGLAPPADRVRAEWALDCCNTRRRLPESPTPEAGRQV